VRPITSWILNAGAALGIGASARGQVCEQDFRWVEALMDATVAQVPLSGASLIVEHHGQIVYQKGFGSFTVDQIVHSASAGKWISACVVMSVIDDGVLSLDSTTGDILGWEGAEGAITVRQLFSHTSGYTDSDCVGDGGSTLEACAEAIRQGEDPVFEPGTGFYYGGSGMQIAARMCEVATGRPWIELFYERLVWPLGWTQTVYTSSTNPRISGGNLTNAPEYIRMLRMMLDGGVWNGQQVLTPSSVEAMLADQTNGAPIVAAPPTVTEFHGYGIGNWVFAKDAQGATIVSSSPGLFGLNPWIDKDRDLACVFAVQSLNILVSPYVAVIRQAVRDAIDFPIPIADADFDGLVTVSDFSIMAAHFGQTSGATKWDGDFTHDGKVNAADFNVLAGTFATSCFE